MSEEKREYCCAQCEDIDEKTKRDANGRDE